MPKRWFFTLSAVLIAALPLAGQDAQKPVVIPSGKYTIESRDSTKPTAMPGWGFELKGNGNFIITSPDGPTFSGTMVQKNGVVSYTDQGGCESVGTYVAGAEKGGYVLNFKADPCEGHKEVLISWFFKPLKK